MSIIAVFNQKGGVGKTTTALNLAAAMAKNNMDPLLIDLDPQAHLTSIAGLRVNSSESIYAFFKDGKPLTELVQKMPNGVNIIPSHVELAKIDTLIGKGARIITRLKDALAREMLTGSGMPVVIDCCPFLGILSINAMAAADGVLVPIAAEYLAMKGAAQLENSLTGMENMTGHRIPRRYVVTRFVARRRLTQDLMDQMQDRFGNELCRTRISECASITESAGFNQDIFSFAPRSKGAKDYAFLLDELVDKAFIQWRG